MIDRKALMNALNSKETKAQAEEYRNDVIAASEETSKLDKEQARNQGWYQMGQRHAINTLKTEIIVGDYHG